jgi:hypothetical protein
VCGGTENCPTGDVCRSGRCVPPAAPTLATVDGDGSNTPVNPREGVDVPEGLAVGHRTRGIIVVTGGELDALDACRVEQDGRGSPCTFLPNEPDTDGATVRRIALPETIVPGLITLVLSGAAGEARAQVFLLQGEPGPAGAVGADGAPGVDSLVDVRPPGGECPATGILIVGGPDTNRNGVLDEDEIETSRALCADANGAIDCAGGVCTFASPIAVPGIKVANNDVVQALSASVVVNVPGDAPTVAAALARFNGIAIPPGVAVTIRIAAGTHVEPARVRVAHPDGERISIVGAGRQSTIIDAPSGFLQVVTKFGRIDGMTAQGSGSSAGVSVDGGLSIVGGDVEIRGFENGIDAFSGTVIVEPGATIAENVIGVHAAEGHVRLVDVEVQDNSFIGVNVDLLATIFMSFARISGSPRALRCAGGSVVLGESIDVSLANNIGFEALTNCTISASSAQLGDTDLALAATLSGTIHAPGYTGTGRTSVDTGGLIIGP